MNAELKVCCFTPLLIFASLKLAQMSLLRISHIYICLDIVLFYYHLNGKSASWSMMLAPFPACEIYSAEWILIYTYMWTC